jgi:hypothetical protein
MIEAQLAYLLQTLEHTIDLHACFYKFHLENMDQIVLVLGYCHLCGSICSPSSRKEWLLLSKKETAIVNGGLLVVAKDCQKSCTNH